MHQLLVPSEPWLSPAVHGCFSASPSCTRSSTAGPITSALTVLLKPRRPTVLAPAMHNFSSILPLLQPQVHRASDGQFTHDAYVPHQYATAPVDVTCVHAVSHELPSQLVTSLQRPSSHLLSRTKTAPAEGLLQAAKQRPILTYPLKHATSLPCHHPLVVVTYA